MGEFADFFKDKKNLFSILILGILILALPIVVNIRRQQIIKSRAAEDPVTFTGANVSKDKDGKWVSTKTVVSLKLTSPLGPPAPTNAVNYTQCSNDADCISVRADSCGCTAGGKATAINKQHTSEWNTAHPAGICTQVMSSDWTCVSSNPKCVSNQCQLVRRQ